MTEKFQVSGKDQAGRIFVVGGDSYGEFASNLGAMLDADPADYINELGAIIGLTPRGSDDFATAQRVAQQGLGATPYQQEPQTSYGQPPWQTEQDPFPPQPQGYQQQRATAPPPGGPAPSCVHGPKKWVEGGISKKTGRPYNGFYACPAPQGQQCAR